MHILNRLKATTEDLPEIFNGDCIPMITELVNDGNVQFLDQVCSHHKVFVCFFLVLLPLFWAADLVRINCMAFYLIFQSVQ